MVKQPIVVDFREVTKQPIVVGFHKVTKQPIVAPFDFYERMQKRIWDKFRLKIEN